MDDTRAVLDELHSNSLTLEENKEQEVLATDVDRLLSEFVILMHFLGFSFDALILHAVL